MKHLISHGQVSTFVQNFDLVKDDQLYIVLTLNEGIVFKKVKNELLKSGSLRMISTNPEYKPYDLSVLEIREIWKFVLYISDEVPEALDNSQTYIIVYIMNFNAKSYKTSKF